MEFNKIINDVANLKVVSPYDNFDNFACTLFEEIGKSMLGCIVIKPDLSTSVGGYYTSHLSIDRIVMPRSSTEYDEETHTVKFTEEGCRVFLHEGSHYMHLTRDKGIFTCKKYIGQSMKMDEVKNPKKRFAAEYEAGVRALTYTKMYNIDCYEDVLVDNVQNLIAYRETPYQWYKDLDKLSTEEASKTIKKYIKKHIEENNTKFSDYHDIDTVEIRAF